MDDIPDFLLRKNWINGMPPAQAPPKASKPFRLIGTYTLLNSYKNCPEQMAHRYVHKDLGPFVETPEMAWGNKVHTAFENRVGAGKPLPADMQQWEQFAAPFDGRAVRVEQKLGVTAEGKACDFWADNVWFRGKADVTIVDEEIAYIGDFKTGGSKYEDPFELATNAVLIGAKYPHVRDIFGHYIWLKENRISDIHDVSDTRETWRQMCRLMGEIETDMRSGNWHKKQSGLCSWCSVKQCEHWREKK